MAANTQDAPETFEELVKEITGQIESKKRKVKVLRDTNQKFRADLNEREVIGMQYVLDQFKKFVLI